MSESNLVEKNPSNKDEIYKMPQKNESDHLISIHKSDINNVLIKQNDAKCDEKIHNINLSTRIVSPTGTLSNDSEVNDINILNYSSSEENKQNENNKLNYDRNEILITRLDYRNDDMHSSSNSNCSNKIQENEIITTELNTGSINSKYSNELIPISKRPNVIIGYSDENVDESYDNFNIESIEKSDIIGSDLNNQEEKKQILNEIKINPQSNRQFIGTQVDLKDKLLTDSQSNCNDGIGFNGTDYLNNYNTKSFIIADNKTNTSSGDNDFQQIR